MKIKSVPIPLAPCPGQAFFHKNVPIVSKKNGVNIFFRRSKRTPWRDLYKVRIGYWEDPVLDRYL